MIQYSTRTLYFFVLYQRDLFRVRKTNCIDALSTTTVKAGQVHARSIAFSRQTKAVPAATNAQRTYLRGCYSETNQTLTLGRPAPAAQSTASCDIDCNNEQSSTSRALRWSRLPSVHARKIDMSSSFALRKCLVDFAMASRESESAERL